MFRILSTSRHACAPGTVTVLRNEGWSELGNHLEKYCDAFLLSLTHCDVPSRPPRGLHGQYFVELNVDEYVLRALGSRPKCRLGWPSTQYHEGGLFFCLGGAGERKGRA